MFYHNNKERGGEAGRKERREGGRKGRQEGRQAGEAVLAHKGNDISFF